MTPSHQPLLETIHRFEKKSGFFVCGDGTRNMAPMASIGAEFFGVDENVDLKYICDVAYQHNVGFAGNLLLASVMLCGTPEENYQAAVDCLKEGGKKGFFLCPGCDIPFAIPVENVQAIIRAIHLYGT